MIMMIFSALNDSSMRLYISRCARVVFMQLLLSHLIENFERVGAEEKIQIQIQNALLFFTWKFYVL